LIPSRTPSHQVQKNHPLEQIIIDKNAGIETRGMMQEHRQHSSSEPARKRKTAGQASTNFENALELLRDLK
jgi:hypothetical protein